MLLPDDHARAFMPYPAVAVPNAADGPLAGLTFAVKDLFDVAGYPTSAGSPHILAMSGINTRHAAVVARLLDSGARFVGKTITDELAFSLTGKNAHFGTPVNGGAPDRVPGGSSSGSAAAVSGGLCDFALGTDTGGSVRGPASHCGLLGLRPTHGRISLDGCHDLAPSFDTCGFLARDPDVFLRVGEVLLGADAAPLPATPRLLIGADTMTFLDTEVRAVIAPCIAEIERRYGPATMIEAAEEGFADLYWAFRHLQGREAWEVDGPMIERFRPPLGPGVADRFEFARSIDDAKVEEGRLIRARFTARLERLLGADGVLILPTMPDVAPLLTQDESSLNDYRNRALNLLLLSGLSGCPQVSMPLLRREDAPLGLSLLGPKGSDLSLLRLASDLAPLGAAC